MNIQLFERQPFSLFCRSIF